MNLNYLMIIMMHFYFDDVDAAYAHFEIDFDFFSYIFPSNSTKFNIMIDYVLFNCEKMVIKIIKNIPHPGIEPGPPGWEPGILTI